MGCDIHLYTEKQINGVWVTAENWVADDYDEEIIDVPWKDRFTNRDYDLFGFLANVRRDHDYYFKPRGLPIDICKEVKAICEYWEGDGHSHSYLYLHELKDAINFLEDKTITVSGMKEEKQLKEFFDSINSEDPTNWELLYPFCQWTNRKDYLEFSIEMPALEKLSNLKEIISLFDRVDGENHRIVFWFDN